MLLSRNKYLLAISTLALLLGAALWLNLPAAPLIDVTQDDVEHASSITTAVDESLTQTAVTSSTIASGNPPNAALPAIATEPSAAVNDTVEASEPASTLSAGTSKEESTATESLQPEPARPTLSPRVYNVISEVQERQLAGHWEEALNEMNALYSEFDQLTPFEQATLLNFYTNTLARLEMWQESITAFNLMLQVPDLRPDLSARALLALGQLHAQEGERVEGIAYLREWLNFTNGMENMDALTPRVSDMLTCLSNTDGMHCAF